MSNPNRKSGEQTPHDKQVSVIANELKSKGYDVKADHIGWKDGSPNQIKNHIPDIFAEKSYDLFNIGLEQLVVEVETESTYSSEHTKEQLEEFAIFNVKLYVPHSCFSDASKKLIDWHLPNVTLCGY